MKIPLRDNKRDLLIKINEFHDEVTINSVIFDTIYHGDDTKKMRRHIDFWFNNMVFMY